MLQRRHILLVISGGIAAYKSLELIRRLRDRGARVRVVLTAGGARFITPLACTAVSGEKTLTELFSPTDENEIGHIRIARDAELVVVAPASADLLAKMAGGLADDLASTVLLATRAPVLVAPAMNPAMWAHPATRANIAALEQRGIFRVGPSVGEMAERGEAGEGRMAEPAEILAAVERLLGACGGLAGRRALVTSGPTFEPLDPVRVIANRSSGKQGHAIAAALARLGADTLLVTGPTAEPDPAGCRVVRIETAAEMLAACERGAPYDVAVMVAAVADWRPVERMAAKMKKAEGQDAPVIRLEANPDILARLSAPGAQRPKLVIGFAAETENVVENAIKKRDRKKCDWIVANRVGGDSGTFGGDENTVHLITADGVEDWARLSKIELGDALAQRIAKALGPGQGDAQCAEPVVER